VRNPYPGQDEEPGVIGKGGEIRFTDGAIPAYKAISRGRFPGRGAKEQARQRAIMAVTNQILHILAHGRAMSQIVILRQKSAEEPMIIRGGLYGRNGQGNKASQRTAYCFASMRRR
jgi:hypothetical protein